MLPKNIENLNDRWFLGGNIPRIKSFVSESLEILFRLLIVRHIVFNDNGLLQ
jgi:hypothetical protein